VSGAKGMARNICGDGAKATVPGALLDGSQQLGTAWDKDVPTSTANIDATMSIPLFFTISSFFVIRGRQSLIETPR
jgi:hypothetical protein